MIDLDELEREIAVMTSRTKLFKTLKRALSAIGRWRNRSRGDPSEGYKAMKRKENVG